MRPPVIDHIGPKNLVGIPWRVAFALQADGWYLRSDIIWSKPNPMPESVTDRPTKSHEYVFLLTKSPRYYFDADAVREPVTETSISRLAQPGLPTQIGSDRVPGKTNGNMKAVGDPSGRNIRSVWTIATQPYPGAHFATFPEKLVEPCVKAGTSERGVCPACGAPWVRAIEKSDPRPVRGNYLGPIEEGAKLDGRAGFHGAGKKGGMVRTDEGWSFLKRDNLTVGWEPSCDCLDNCGCEYPCSRGAECGCACHNGNGGAIPATVLDPFAGSGTVGRVANRLGRRAVLIDLSADYIDQAMLRNAQAPLGLGA
jgi:hypothetical protein